MATGLITVPAAEHAVLAPACCHATIMIHGIRDDGVDEDAGMFESISNYFSGNTHQLSGWFSRMTQMLRATPEGKNHGYGKLPVCHRVFGVTWKVNFEKAVATSPYSMPYTYRETDKPGFEQVIGRKLHRGTEFAGKRLAMLCKHIRQNILRPGGYLSIFAHSQGTEVTGVALQQLGPGVVDCAVLIGSPIIPELRAATVNAYRNNVKILVNCASTTDEAMTPRYIASGFANTTWGRWGLNRTNVGDKLIVKDVDFFGNPIYERQLNNHIPASVPSANGHQEGDVFINTFKHGDWHEPEKFERPPEYQAYGRLLMKVLPGPKHGGEHHRPTDAAISRLKVLAAQADVADPIKEDGIVVMREMMHGAHPRMQPIVQRKLP